MDIKTVMNSIAGLNKKSRIGISLGVAAALVAAGSLAFSRTEGHAAAAKAEAPVTASAITVQSRTIDSVVTAAGALASKNVSVLSSKVMGRVSFLGVQEGDQVTAGKLLLKIDSGEITAQAVQAQAAYNNAKLHYDRIKSLYDAKASTQMEMDQATLGFETAQAGLKAAKAMESYVTINAPIAGQVVEARGDREGAGYPAYPARNQGEGADRRHARQGHPGHRITGRFSLRCADPFVHCEDRYPG
jgi:multidrug efflux pump subunit AcrA (membrane-fusion protein)